MGIVDLLQNDEWAPPHRVQLPGYTWLGLAVKQVDITARLISLAAAFILSGSLLEAGWAKTRVFLKKPTGLGFIGFYWVLLGFLGFFGFFNFKVIETIYFPF